MYLIKAETEVNGAPGAPAPLALLRPVRARSFTTDPLSAAPLAAILRERLFELTFEGKRRQDLIRFGQYTVAWQFKTAGQPRLTLMPIPQSQIDGNPQLAQNQGYRLPVAAQKEADQRRAPRLR